MNNQKIMNICYLCDGKAGHQAQVIGLISALQTCVTVNLDTIMVNQTGFARWFTAYSQLKFAPNVPDLIIGAGHATHIPLWLMGKRFKTAKTLVLMKPSLPITCFDYAIIPAHDNPINKTNIFVSQGVLNRFVNENRHQLDKIFILVGGENKRYDFNDYQIFQAIQQLCNYYQNQPTANFPKIIITSSRRTPHNLVTQLTKFCQSMDNVQFFPMEKTTSDWLNEQYQTAAIVWVTADSVNMIFEALTAGCQVGVIDLSKKKTDRVTIMLDNLITDNKVVRLSDFLHGKEMPKPNVMNEAKRASEWLLQKL